jgi:hypothetical protein
MLTDLIAPSKDTIWQIGLKKNNNLLPIGDLSHQQKQALADGERLEEDLPSHWSPKTGRGSNTYLGQNILQTYIDQT